MVTIQVADLTKSWAQSFIGDLEDLAKLRAPIFRTFLSFESPAESRVVVRNAFILILLYEITHVHIQ